MAIARAQNRDGSPAFTEVQATPSASMPQEAAHRLQRLFLFERFRVFDVLVVKKWLWVKTLYRW